VGGEIMLFWFFRVGFACRQKPNVHNVRWILYFFCSKIFNQCSFFGLLVTVSIRIVAECEANSCQITKKLKRATTLEFTTITAIIFILCYQLAVCPALLWDAI